MTIKEISGYTIGSLLMSIGIVITLLNGITFQNFVNLFM